MKHWNELVEERPLYGAGETVTAEYKGRPVTIHLFVSPLDPWEFVTLTRLLDMMKPHLTEEQHLGYLLGLELAIQEEHERYPIDKSVATFTDALGNPISQNDFEGAVGGEGWAIADYQAMLADATPEEAVVIKHIIEEEKEHLQELLAMKQNPAPYSCCGVDYEEGVMDTIEWQSEGRDEDGWRWSGFSGFTCDKCGKNFNVRVDGISTDPDGDNIQIYDTEVEETK